MKGATGVAALKALGLGVSIHAPREGRDVPPPSKLSRPRQFQSTRPVKGATTLPDVLTAVVAVSIHAPREGRDS